MKAKLFKLAKEVLVTALLAVVVMTGYNLYLQRDMPSGQAPVVQATSVNGLPVDLHELSREQPVLVYFWASWCSVCSWVSPSVSKVAENYPVVSIALASGSDERVRRYLQAKELSFTTVNDDDGTISRAWGVSVTPSLFVVKNGEIESVTTGYTTTAGMLARLWWHGR